MNKSTWQRAKEIFDEARGLGPDQRATLVDGACAANVELRSQVERLLGAYDSDFLEEPALGAAESLVSHALEHGQMIGRYRIREMIGTGGMGQVFLADDTELDRPVAFKVLHHEVAEDQERVRRFMQEARAASALNHPNILTIHEIGAFEGCRFIVSEYVEGETLRERMKKGMTVAESVDITCQVAAALQAAHSAGIVHRDIKPENVMIRRDALVKVLDFGLAKLTAADDHSIVPGAPIASAVLTNPGLVMGTAAYMSPEQARGNSVDSRTDLWSLGVCFHEMLTGKSPFEGDSVTDIITSILKTETTLPTSDNVPPELQPICNKALAKEKESRYQSAHDLLKDLQGEKKKMEYAIESMPYVSLPGRTDELKTQLIRPRATLSAEYLFTEIKRHKYATAGTLTAALLVATALLVYSYKDATPSANSNAVRPVITLSTTERDLKMSRLPTSGKVYDIAISSDGKYVAYVSGETDEKNPIRLRRTDSGAPDIELVAAPDRGRLANLSFSPEGKYVYYQRRVRGLSPWEIDRVPVAGGASAKVITDSDGGASVSPDGRFVAFSRDLNNREKPIENAEELLVADADGTHERVVLHTPWAVGTVTQEASWVECPSRPPWSPDGKKIACGKHYKLPNDEYYKLIAVNVSDGSQEELSETKWWDIHGAVWLADGNVVIVSKESTVDQGLPFQLWLVSKGTEPKQITNGLIGYDGLTATSKGDVLATVQSGANVDLWLVPQLDASQARQITSSGELAGGFDWMRDGRIIFASKVTGNVDLWSMNPDGTGRRQITSAAGANKLPVVSPDGRYIVFTSTRLGRFDDHIFRMDADGGNVKQLTNGLREWWPKISADGKWVYFIQVYDDRPHDICKISIDGGQPAVLATTGGQGRTDIIDLARDGSVVFEENRVVQGHSERTLYRIPANGGKPVRILTLPLTAGWGIGNATIMWRFTPDGRSIAFNDTRNGEANIWTIPANGKGTEKPITNFGPGSIAIRFVWSPDGKQLLMTRGNLTNDGILITNAGH